MSSPLERMIGASVSCFCCGNPGTGRCACAGVDRCERTLRCCLHCHCPRCAANRVQGFARVSWTGRPHVARALGLVTLCGRAVPFGPYPSVSRVPILDAPGCGVSASGGAPAGAACVRCLDAFLTAPAAAAVRAWLDELPRAARDVRARHRIPPTVGRAESTRPRRA